MQKLKWDYNDKTEIHISYEIEDTTFNHAFGTEPGERLNVISVEVFIYDDLFGSIDVTRLLKEEYRSAYKSILKESQEHLNDLQDCNKLDQNMRHGRI